MTNEQPTQPLRTHLRKCKKCAYAWKTRSPRVPRKCPNCQSRKWHIELQPDIFDQGKQVTDTPNSQQGGPIETPKDPETT